MADGRSRAQYTIGSVLVLTTGVAIFLGLGSVEGAVMYVVAMTLLPALLVLGNRWKWSLWTVLAVFFVLALLIGFGVAVIIAEWSSSL